MAKLTAPLLSFNAKGRFSEALVYQRGRKRNVVKQHGTTDDRQSTGQLTQRSIFKSVCDTWSNASQNVQSKLLRFDGSTQNAVTNVYPTSSVTWELSYKLNTFVGTRYVFGTVGTAGGRCGYGTWNTAPYPMRRYYGTSNLNTSAISDVSWHVAEYRSDKKTYQDGIEIAAAAGSWLFAPTMPVEIGSAAGAPSSKMNCDIKYLLISGSAFRAVNAYGTELPDSLLLKTATLSHAAVIVNSSALFPYSPAYVQQGWLLESSLSRSSGTGFQLFSSNALRAIHGNGGPSFVEQVVRTLSTSVMFGMVNPATGTAGTESGTFTAEVGTSPRALDNIFYSSGSAALPTFDFSSTYGPGAVVYVRLSKEAGSAQKINRSGIWEITLT